jgi:uncharacterized protein (TIGR03067 family)
MRNFRIALLIVAVAVAAPSVLAGQSEAAKQDMAQLQGEWSMATAGGGGQSVLGSMFKNSRRVCKGDETSVTVGGQLLMRATFSLDPSKTPKTIDYHVTAGSNSGKDLLGIYELDGDTVRFCFSAPGFARPTDFDSKPGDGRTASRWKRERK